MRLKDKNQKLCFGYKTRKVNPEPPADSVGKRDVDQIQLADEMFGLFMSRCDKVGNQACITV